MVAKKWTEKENEFIGQNYQNISNQELAKKFKVTPKSIEGKLRKLGLKRKKVVSARKEGKASTGKLDRSALHGNIRCRVCFLVDGYRDKEEYCRFCGAKLFKQDVL